jgi:hypothetical protein
MTVAVTRATPVHSTPSHSHLYRSPPTPLSRTILGPLPAQFHSESVPDPYRIVCPLPLIEPGGHTQAAQVGAQTRCRSEVDAVADTVALRRPGQDVASGVTLMSAKDGVVYSRSKANPSTAASCTLMLGKRAGSSLSHTRVVVIDVAHLTGLHWSGAIIPRFDGHRRPQRRHEDPATNG